MAVKILVQYRPGYPQTSSTVQAPMWMDITERVDFASLQWEQQATDKNTSLRFDVFTFLPISDTRYDEYPSWSSESAPVDPADPDPRLSDAVHDVAFFIELTNRAEIKVVDGADVLFGGVIGVVDTQRSGSSHVVQQVEAYDYTALLDEIVVRDYNAPNVSETLGELATTTGLTSQVVTGGSTLIAGPYTFRVIAVDSSGNPLVIFTHITQYISSTDVSPANISDTPLRTIELTWDEITDPALHEYIVYGKQGIGTNNMYYQASVAAGTETYSISTTPVTNTATSPEQYVQKGSIDVDIVIGSSDPANGNYNGIFNAIDPALDPGINHSTYVKPAKVLTNGDPDPDKSYRFSPTLETGVVLTSPFGGKTLKQALKAITDKTGAIFWVDADKNLHYANKKAQELVQNPRFDSNTQNWTLGVNHTIGASRGPFGYGNALVASSSSGANETKSDPIEVTSGTVYMARVRGWADAQFSSDWDCELRYYSDAEGTVQVGNSHKLHRNVAYDSADEQRWCKTWVIAESHNTAVSARLVAKRKNGASGACAWTDFSLIEITGTYGFSDNPSESAYDVPMRSFETPRAPREASGVANRLLVYGVYKDPTNTAELESIVYDAGLTLTKAQGGSLDANTYWVRVIAETPNGDVYVKYATETITDADVAAVTPVRTLSANWASVPGATQYRIYIGSGRMQMRLKATQAGTSLSITTMPAGGAALSGEPDVYYYKTFDFAPGLWESGGKVVEATLNDQLVDSEEKAQTRALSFWEEKGIAMRTWEFDHLEEPPMVGSVIPFVWAADDIAEPLIVKGNKGKFLGDRIYWTTTVGSDPSLIKKGVTQIFADLKQATLRLNDTLAPARPLGLDLTAPTASLIQTVDGVSRATVVAEWQPSSEDDFAHYVVQYGYDANFANAQVINVAQTPNVRAAATGETAKVVHSFQAEPGKRLYFRAAAQDRTGNRSDFTDAAIDLPADTTPPDAPTNVQVTASLKSMAVTWSFGFYDPALPDQNTNNTDFSRFRVYRKQYNAGTNPNEPWVKVTETSTNVFIDTAFPNYTNLYQYKVSTVDRTGNESAAVQEATPTWRSPNKITGTVDIEDATITSAQIASLSANLINTGTLNVSTGMSIVSDGTAEDPQFEVGPNGVIIRDDAGNTVLEVNGATANLFADYLNVTGVEATEITVGSGGSVVRVGNYPDSITPTFQGIWGGSSNPSSASFTLATNGAVTASNITATGGTIGGWAIDSNKIYQALAVSPYIAGIYTGSSSSSGLTFFAGATTSTGTSASFTVTNAGAVTATNANITGTVSTNNITATGGTVGGWTLSSTSLTSGTGASTVGIATSGGYAFYAGDSTPASAEFRVTPGGALTATDATITGSVTATSGSIGGWSIGAATISSSSGNVVLSNSGIITAGATSPDQAHMSGNGFWAGAGAADYATAPFRVSTSGGVTAKNISVIGGTVSVGDAPVSISYLSRNASGVVTIKTSAAVNATVGQNITIDVTSSPWATDADFNGSFNVLSITASSPYTLTYQGATSSTVTEVAATGFVYTGARISGESASGTWFSVDSGFALKNPANVSQNIITATASDVTINADFIKAGTVTLGNLGSNAISSTNFSVSNTGTITAKDGTIGGWTLGTSSITNIGSSKYVGLLDSATDTDIAIFAGATNAAGSGAVFSVKNDGTISATSGTIGGWTLGSSSLTAGTGATSVGVSTGSTTFYAGNANPESAPFRVTSGGALMATDANITGTVSTNNITATGGTVGGWTLISTGTARLYSGTTSAFTGLVASATSSGVAIFAGASDNAGTSPAFSVTNAGAMTATAATITGSVTATSGSVGGWAIDSSKIYNALAISPYISGMQGSSTSTGVAFFAGGTTSTGATAAFKVTNEGAVAASNITATGGTVGGWTLASSRLYSSATFGGTTKWYGVVADPVLLGKAFFAGATNSAGDSAVFEVLNDGSVTASNLSITGGPSGGNVINVNSGAFLVSSTGGLTATSASVTGAITATSGAIGGWSIGSDKIYNSGTSKFIGLVDAAADSDIALFAGATTSAGTGATFSVTNAGALTATNASVSGSITASGGSIGGWSIGLDKIYNSGVSKFIGLVDAAADSDIAIFAGATNSTGSGATFAVTNEGAVTASSGTIAGWTIASDRIWSGSGSSYVGMSTGTTSFFAGANTSSGGSALFSVTNAGALSATNATLSSVTVNPAGGTPKKPAMLLQGAKNEGDIAVPASSSATLTNYTRTASEVTLTTSANHNFAAGANVTITGSSVTTFNSTFAITAVTENTFTFVLPGTPVVTPTSSGGTASSSSAISFGVYNTSTFAYTRGMDYLPKDSDNASRLTIYGSDGSASRYGSLRLARGDGSVAPATYGTISYNGSSLTFASPLSVTGGVTASGSIQSTTGTIESGVNGSTRGAFFARGDGTNGGYIALYSGVGSAGGTLSYDVANGRFNMNNDLNVQGVLSGTSSISAATSITAGTTVTVDDTSAGGIIFNLPTGTDGQLYYVGNTYFVFNDDLRINMAATASTSDVYINSSSTYGTLARFSSARRYKKDIQDFNVPLSDIVQLRPVTFKWNPETTRSTETGEITGLIAEEVESISDAMKRICRYNEETGEIESVQYSQLAVFLVGAIKELAQQNTALEARIAELEG